MTDDDLAPVGHTEEWIIDCRLRPPARGFLGTQMYDRDTIHRISSLVLGKESDGPSSAVRGDCPALVTEMDAAHIRYGVALGRWRPNTEVPNEALVELCTTNPSRFVGMASLNPLDSTRWDSSIEYILKHGCLRGVALDLSAVGLRMDDGRLYRMYERCEAAKLPIAVTLSSLMAQDLSLIDPVALDRAARDFPDLQIIAAHANYPYTMEALGVAARRTNVWLEPDFYMTHFAGGGLFVEAANGFLGERILFGSGYPYVEVGDAVQRVEALPLSTEARARLLRKNAERILAWRDSS